MHMWSGVQFESQPSSSPNRSSIELATLEHSKLPAVLHTNHSATIFQRFCRSVHRRAFGACRSADRAQRPSGRINRGQHPFSSVVRHDVRTRGPVRDGRISAMRHGRPATARHSKDVSKAGARRAGSASRHACVVCVRESRTLRR